MSLTVYPQAPPINSSSMKTLDRGQQNVILSNIGAVQTFSGTALPVGSIGYAVPSAVDGEVAIENFTFQIDSGGGTPAAVIRWLGSLDGTTWYDVLGAGMQAAGTYGLFFSSKLLSGAYASKLRYISAYCSAYGGSGGTTDSITVSVFA
jgi:hypothetical protein